MSHVIETARLELRPFEVGDEVLAHEWCTDPDVMRYFANGPDRSLHATETRVARYRAHQAAYGFSRWMAFERRSSRAIGDAGLLVMEDEGWIDLGFRLRRDCWGQGLATEMAEAWIRVAFEELELAALGAFAHVDNTASLRVLEKVGFQHVRDDEIQGLPSRVFRLAGSRPAHG